MKNPHVVISRERGNEKKFLEYCFLLCVPVLISIMACAPETELSSAEIENGLAQLENIETLGYEYVIEVTNENGTGSIRYDVEMDRDTGDYTYAMYVDETLVSEKRRENGMSYWKVNGEWYETKNVTEPPYPVDIIPEEEYVETVKRSETDGNVRIEITLNDAALRQRESDIRQAGEDAITVLEEWGIPDESIEAQRELNDLHQTISFTGENRYYVTDRDGVLTEYREVLDYTDNGAAEHSEMIFRLKTNSVE